MVENILKKEVSFLLVHPRLANLKNYLSLSITVGYGLVVYLKKKKKSIKLWQSLRFLN